MIGRRILLFCLFLILITNLAHAQRVTGAIRGDVEDESGAPLPGVSVTVSGPTIMGGSQLAYTDADGGYRFPGLPPGTYKLSFTMEGFQPVTYDDVRVVIGTSIEQNVTMNLSKVSEEMVITGETPLIDPTKAGYSTNYTQEYLENTPISRFTFFDFVQMAPGSAPMRFDNTAFSHSILGSNTNENAYQMDGTDLTSALTGAAWPFPNTDIIEEIEILDIGAPAEYGNYQGAVVNVVTKSGGNEYHGDANIFYQTDALTGENAEIDGIAFHRDQYIDGTFQIGGPIIKDKIWIFGGWQSRREHFSEPGTPPEFPKKQDDDRYFFKVTVDINDKNKIVGSLHNDYYEIPGEISITRPFETALTETGSNPTPNVMWSSTLNDNTFLEVRYAGFYGHDVGEPQNGQYNSGHYDLYTGYYSQGIIYWYDGNIWKSQLSGKLSYYADDFIKGDHDFRFGVQYTNAGNDYISALTNGRFYYDYNNAPYIAYFQLPYHYGADVNSIGFFVDDTWSVSENLTFNLGLRYDRSKGSIPDFPELSAEGGETGTTIAGLNDLAEWNVVSPRLGFTYQFPWKKATQLRGHYGRYYQALLTPYLHFASPSISKLEGFLFNEDTGGFTDLFFELNAAEQIRIDPDLKDPYTDQFAIGFDREITPTLGLSASFVYKRSRDFVGTINTGGVFEQIPFTDPVNGQTIMVFNQLNDASENLYFITNPDFFYENYRGFIISLNKRLTTNWLMNGSLTISKTKGFHAGSGQGPAADQDSSFFPLDNARFGRDPNDYINADGLLNGDRTYIFKLQGTYMFPYDIKLSGNYSWLTGRPYARQIAVTDTLNQGAKVIFAEERDGSRRTSDINLLDIRVEKEFPISGEFRVAVSADIFNLFNSDSFYDVATTLSGPGTEGVFGVGSVFVPPRRVMLGAKLRF
ncbi:MAG TPA: TonB-dependent receptor [Acidobacteriota bacterium]|nr:TonB-dependent receptor [Acidobacteriota bacterium]